MNRLFAGAIGAGLVALSFSTASHAALVSRLGGQAYYDTNLNITWLANANLAGVMDWNAAQSWIAGLNSANYLGYNDWRLPTVGPVNGTSFNYGPSGTFYDGTRDAGYNVSAPGTTYAGSTGSEMANLFYDTLGNKAYYSISGSSPQSGWGLTNSGPFSNLQANWYWSGSAYAPLSGAEWIFGFDTGDQSAAVATSNTYYAMAVRSGDVATVPIPAAAWLFCSGLAGLLGMSRRKLARR